MSKKTQIQRKEKIRTLEVEGKGFRLTLAIGGEVPFSVPRVNVVVDAMLKGTGLMTAGNLYDALLQGRTENYSDNEYRVKTNPR